MCLRRRHESSFIFTLYHCTNVAFAPEYYKCMMGANFSKPSFSHMGFIGLVWVGIPPKDRVRIPMYVLRNKLNPCGAYVMLCMYVYVYEPT